MQFNSYTYILFFLPIVVLLFYLSNRIKPVIGKIVLILASVLFYALDRYNMLIYIGISIVLNYSFSILIKRFSVKAKYILSIPIVINVLLLLYFKYFNFIIINIDQIFGSHIDVKNIILPLGISFYTFQQIAYVIAVSDGRLEETGFIDYLTYILYFPKLLMGPLVDPVDFISQINDETRKRFNVDNLAYGIRMFSFGLFKKTVIADTFAGAVNLLFEELNSATSMDLVLVILFYTFEIYFDFSGYTDMAVGVSTILNIDLPINFDSPYKAVSIRDFWKRWHISLTQFLTKYIYIPLGGSRKGKAFTYLNTMIVFLISGLWHGANWTFVLWGAIHGALSCFDRIFEKVENKVFSVIRWTFTFIAVSILWLLFRAESIRQWWTILGRIVAMNDISVSEMVTESFKVPETAVFTKVLHLGYLDTNIHGFYMIVFIVFAFIICLIPNNNYRTKNKIGIISLGMAAVAFVWGLLCVGSISTFVYFGF